MSRPRTAPRRSGDPRKHPGSSPAPSRDVATPGADSQRRRRLVVSVAVVALSAVGVWIALATLGPSAPTVDEQGRVHAAAACDLTLQAGEAASAVQIDSRSRYAAAALLLDRAVIESARAAESDAALTGLDDTLQAVHTAAHRGDPDRWEAALDAALTACGAATP